MSGSRTEMEQSVHDIFRSNFVNFIKIDFQSKMTDFESRFFIILYVKIPKDITWSKDFLILEVPDSLPVIGITVLRWSTSRRFSLC